MSGQDTGKTGVWSSSRLKSSTRLLSKQAEANIATMHNPFLTPSAYEPGCHNLLAYVNSSYTIAKRALM